MRPLLLVAAIMAAGAPAHAQDRAVSLALEESIVLRLDRSGALTADETRGHAEWTPYDLVVARHLAGLTPPKEPVPAFALPDNGSIPQPPPILPERLRLRFMSIAGQYSILILENGYDRAIVFRARMTRGSETRATDVCLVIPMHFSFEHWPHPLDRIEISDTRFVPWREGDEVTCA